MFFDPPLSEQPGTIALPLASELARFGLHVSSLVGTQQPPGTSIRQVASADVSENLNAIIRDLSPQDAWVWCQGDDHTWQPDALVRMLKIMDENPHIDVLVPLVLKRNPPWIPVIYQALGETDETGHPLFRTLMENEIPESGVFPVDAAGGAGMLIRRHVLEELGDPWFYSTVDTNGRGVVLNEDVTFCTNVRNAGFTIYATADVTLGHIGVFVVRPVKHPQTGQWVALTEFSSTEDQFKNAFMPIGTPA